MFKRTMLLFLICFMGLIQPAVPAEAKQTEYVEIFNIKQRKVIEEIKLTPEIKSMVTDWLVQAEEAYAKVNPIPENGYVVRVPLNPDAALQNKWLYANIEEVYIVIPEKEPPFFVLVGNDGLACYLLHGEIHRLSEALGFNLNAQQ